MPGVARTSKPLHARGGYADLSTRPLHMLVFLAPLIVFYEIGALLWLHGASVQAIGAERVITGFFNTFGVVGRHLPAVAIVCVLLVWHFIRSDPWKVRPAVPLGMTMESIVWVFPVLVLGLLLPESGNALAGLLAGVEEQHALRELPPRSRAVIAVGAGLYEEMLFRMILIAAIHMLAVDLIRLPDHIGKPIAVGGSAGLFAAYHFVGPANEPEPALVAFFILSGLYFGVLYLWRGLGVVVAVHALYDVFALVVLGR